MKDNSYQSKYEQSWALVIGINDYLYTNPLDIACADAEGVTQVLIEELDFPQTNVCTLLNGEATRSKIMERFLAFESITPNARLLIFFAGHGITTPGYRGPVGYLVPCDGRCDDKSTLIRWDELTRGADIIPAKHILFVMDACYSGLGIQRTGGVGERRFVSDMLRRRSRQMVTAGKADETVADGGGPNGKNSIFTGHLLEGLRGNANNSDGVLTASYLMNYVYQKVSNDARSAQTPHFGHLDGDGDFIFRTPKGEHLAGTATNDFLVNPIPERPEPPLTISTGTIKPHFAEKNGYADPESEDFGKNDWSKNLFFFTRSGSGSARFVRPSCWLSLVAEPISNQPVSLDIAGLAKTLLNQQTHSEKPYEHFRMPGQAITTAKAVVLYDQEHLGEDAKGDYWNRYVRIEKTGSIEYCNARGVASIYSPTQLAGGVKVFKYVQLIGTIWSFLYTAKRILNQADYQAGVRFLVNLVGTKDSMLIQFSPKPGVGEQHWRQPLEWETGEASQNWKCRDINLQIPFQLVLHSLSESEAKRLVVECAEQFGLAYNHQSKPRCFNHGTDELPWDQVDPSAM